MIAFYTENQSSNHSEPQVQESRWLRATCEIASSEWAFSAVGSRAVLSVFLTKIFKVVHFIRDCINPEKANLVLSIQRHWYPADETFVYSSASISATELSLIGTLCYSYLSSHEFEQKNYSPENVTSCLTDSDKPVASELYGTEGTCPHRLESWWGQAHWLSPPHRGAKVNYLPNLPWIIAKLPSKAAQFLRVISMIPYMRMRAEWEIHLAFRNGNTITHGIFRIPIPFPILFWA